MALFVVGQVLANGATVVTDTVQTFADGTTVERMVDSKRNETVTVVPGAGSAGANQQTLTQRAQTALTANATYQAIATPSTNQNTAQVQALTKQVNSVIRLLLGQLDSTTGT